MRIFLSAGEPSGDLHGSNLIREMRIRASTIQFEGFGSSKMAAVGCHLHRDMSDLAIMGFARIVPHLRKFWHLYQLAREHFRSQPPDAVVLIDYPGFNWWVARAAKQYDIPVFYYGTPQIWAWATHRVKKLRRLVDHSLCKLPFEPDWYRTHGCEATYVGHPYFDDFTHQAVDQPLVDRFSGKSLITILPGSRKHEVRANLPAFLRTIDKVVAKLPETEFAIASYSQQQAVLARQLIIDHDGLARPSVHVDRTRELMRAATLCLACSGSVSLELLHELKPAIIHYRIHHVENLLQRAFRRCKYITLVNLLISENRFEYRQPYSPDDLEALQEAPYPEYLTVDDKSDAMAKHAIRWLSEPSARHEIVMQLKSLKRDFVKPGASKLAADYILEKINPANRQLPPFAKVA